MSLRAQHLPQHLLTALVGLSLSWGIATHWVELRMTQAETELHETWLPLVTAVGDLRSDLDAWQEDPVPLMVERVDARLSQIRKLAQQASDIGSSSPPLALLDEVQQRWESLHTGRSRDMDGLHDQLRELSVTGLMQSQRLADVASGRGA